MRALSTALYNVMVADAGLTAKLGTFGGLPAIFTKRPVPDAATRPIVIAATVVSDVDADLVASRGREITRDIAVYGDARSDFDKVMDAAEIIRNLFHRRKLAVTGWRTVRLKARGPIEAPAEPQDIGRIVTLTIRLHET